MTDSSRKPLVALTMGDPAGVGPEIVAGAWANPRIHERCRPLVVGHPEIIRRAIKLLGARIDVIEVDAVDQADPSIRVIPCLKSGQDDALDVLPGVVDARAGQAAYDALVAAARLALAGKVDALVTAPLHKVALRRAGHNYPGHTELLAKLCGIENYAMMLYVGPGVEVHFRAGLAVVHVTLHMALAEAVAQLSTEAILTKSRLVDSVMTQLAGSRPRIGVCALNPHAGEDGLFGSEEHSIIAPAVDRGQREGLNLIGPLPCDTLFARARDGEFDALVAMYHDQGHIPIKLLARHSAVNVTLGLPIVRTSVAHGTAFDLAWQGRAETKGMVTAIEVASRLAGIRK